MNIIDIRVSEKRFVPTYPRAPSLHALYSQFPYKNPCSQNLWTATLHDPGGQKLKTHLPQ
jgi:hypothetical protein